MKKKTQNKEKPFVPKKGLIGTHQKVAVLSVIIMGNFITFSGFLWTLDPICFSQEIRKPVWTSLYAATATTRHQVPPQGEPKEHRPQHPSIPSSGSSLSELRR